MTAGSARGVNLKSMAILAMVQNSRTLPCDREKKYGICSCFVKIAIKNMKMRKKPETIEEVMKRWPSLTGHVICHSLGYCTPRSAAKIVLDASEGRENWCEWIYSCYNRNPMPAVQMAIKTRHHHKGYLAHYPHAIALVRRYLLTGEEPVLASWF